MNLILFGYRGAGKTTVGKFLAKKLDRPFVDTDWLIKKRYFKKWKRELSVKEIYEEYGESFFRQEESTVIKSIFKIKKSIIALGGGSLLCKKNRELVSQMGLLVYLYTQPVDHKLYRERIGGYQKMQAITINAGCHKSIQLLMRYV